MEKEPDTTMLRPIVVHPNEGAVLEAFGDTVQVKLRGEDTGGSLTLGLGVTPPGGGPPPHLHRSEDEMFLILEGRYQFLIGGEWTDVGPGSVVYVPRGAIHTFRNAGDAPSRHWLLTTPSGFETFFEKCAAVFTEAGPPDMPRVLSICAEHGIEFTDTPGTTPDHPTR